MFSNSILKKRSSADWLSYVIAELTGEALRVWFVMLLLGSLHKHISPNIPALGYWETFAVLMLLGLALTDIVRGGVVQGLRRELA